MNRSGSHACPNFHQVDLARRHVLKIGGAGLFGLTLPKLWAAEAASRPAPPKRAKSVIFLFQWGGPSHLETFDMKPNAAEQVRGFFNPISTNVPDMSVCEHLPAMARVMDKVTLVHGMHHTMKNHNSAGYYALSGHSPLADDQRLRDSLDLFPAYGSVVDRLAPVADGMPTFVAYPHVIRDGSITPGQHASFLGKFNDPLLITADPASPDFSLPELGLPRGVSVERLESRRELLRLVDRQAGLLEYSATARGIDAAYDRALSMLSSKEVKRAFDLSAEDESTRDRYGRTTYGQGCLLARRLVEAGVRFVSVYFAESIGGQSFTGGGWDTHGFNNTRMFPILKANQLPLTDQTLPTLLTDLDERGLLDETLVVWVGEFGRTPEINKDQSRHHWPQCYTALLAGGGVKRGHVSGASDRNGAYPVGDPVRPDDLAATMYYLLGIDPATEVHDALGRPLPITYGQPLLDVVA